MSEGKDPAIKLFGKTIPVSSASEEIGFDDGLSSEVGGCESENRVDKNAPVDAKQDDQASHETLEELKDPATSSANSDSPKSPSCDNESKVSKEDQSDTSSSQDKVLKKPDKILPCPRCNSMDTKFCYFNNYNVNQPRHFCKNCQRYWTAGGTMRNVPVGAGRRKNKSSSASQHRHIVIPEGFQVGRPDAVNGIIHPAMGANNAVLAFGTDMPLCESMASGLKLAEKSHIDSTNQVNGSSAASSARVEKGGNGSSVQEPAMKNFAIFPPHVPCIPAPPWPYPLNPAEWSATMPPPPFLPPGFPMPFYPAPPYWGCGIPGAWPIPWGTPVSISHDPSLTSSNPNSPTLGKHTRDGNVLNHSNSNSEEGPRDQRSGTRVLVPKTLRIDDPSEAAMSSIWATLGIKNEKGESLNPRDLFRGFQSNLGPRNSNADKSLLLQANPAALSRSVTFQESAE